ncbi:hypothetical protein [Aggregatibacter aphrophilus]|uniref:hypothetical protein n=1 Tax=Aggregatibacter aphrophilus TaxID=732 RepID=UPI000D654929|nr:hypothetical protein [Aggregatibacter aphrophilus]
MTKQKSMLVQALKEEIAAIELEKKEIDNQIKQLDKAYKEAIKKISDYRVALNHAKGPQSPPLLKTPKPKNLRFQTSPQQLIAQVLKQTPSEWLSVKDITREAMKLDVQAVGEDLPYPQLQTITCTLYYLKDKSLVEKCTIDKVIYWRLKAFE